MPEIKLPQIGKATSGTVRKWRKKPGDPIHKGDILLEIETDDGVVELEAASSGTLQQILIPEGRTVALHTPLAVLGDAAASAAPVSTMPAMAATPAAAASPQAPASAKPAGKVIPILMPKAGQSMEEGVLVKWHVQPGAVITQGQVIFEIETDKATMDVEATDSGRLARITLAEGGVSKVLEPVAFLADNDGDVDAYLASTGTGAAPAAAAAPTAAASPAPAVAAPAATQPAPTTDGSRVKASPAARKAAAELNINLNTLGMGSGPGGRILSTDVQAASARPASPAPAAPAAPAPAPASTTTEGGVVRRRMSQMRKAIAKNLSLSKQTIPHFYIKATINADPLYTFYQGEKAKYPCSLNDVVVMACAKAIREFPQFRSRIEGEEIVEFPSVNIGIAVGMDDGLVVPVLVGADQMNLKQIGAETKRIANSARAGKIEGMGKGMFTISNMGMFGVEEFSAIINPPESAILAVGTIREEVIVSGGTLRPGRVMSMTLSVDHRVIDGSLAAKFLGRLKEILEWPAQLV